MFKRDKLFASSESEQFEVYPGDVRSPRGRRQPGPAERHVTVDRLHSTQPPISNSTTAGRGVCPSDALAAAANVVQTVTQQQCRCL
jgi:hypothetical protein